MRAGREGRTDGGRTIRLKAPPATAAAPAEHFPLKDCLLSMREALIEQLEATERIVAELLGFPADVQVGIEAVDEVAGG